MDHYFQSFMQFLQRSPTSLTISLLKSISPHRPQFQKLIVSSITHFIHIERLKRQWVLQHGHPGQNITSVMKFPVENLEMCLWEASGRLETLCQWANSMLETM